MQEAAYKFIAWIVLLYPIAIGLDFWHDKLMAWLG